MNNYVIQCENLHKRFKEGELYANVLRGVNLRILPGEQVAIIGHSGSGKSTLLHLLGGLDMPTEGEVTVMGKAINRLSPAQQSTWRNQHLGFIYQFHHLLPEFTALENVSIPLLIRGTSSEEAFERASQILTQVGLGHRLKHKPGELSGGERQRTAVARALVTRPCCILADEPTGNLDQSTAKQVYETMVALNFEIKTSLLLVTHDPTLAKRMDKMLRLVDGVLIEG